MQIKEIISKEQLKAYLEDYEKIKGQKSLHRAIQNSKKLQNLIISFTSDENDLSISARSSLIINNIDRPLCKVCGSKTNFEPNNRRFLECCSVACAAINPERILKINTTNLEKYGNKNYWGSNIHQENLKIRSLKKYGEEHYFKSEDFKQKSEETSIKKYGTKKPQYSDKIKEKISNTRNSLDKKMISEKARITFLQNYGVDHPMKNIDHFNMITKKSFYRKDFSLPSGKVIQLQGFEPICLTELLKTYNEDQILMTPKDIFKELGPIDYIDENNKIRRYYPDFYIVPENKIIEVKSDRTFNIHKNINLSKRQECEKRGFKFEFWIYSNKDLIIR